MRFNVEIRNGIMRVVMQRGGIATLRQMSKGLTAAGIKHYQPGLVYYVLQLRKDESLIQIGHAVYCTPEYLEDEGAGIFLRLPYGMCAKGWALHYLLTHRVAGPVEIHAYLVKRGVVTSKQSTYTALWQLRAAGFVDTLDRAHYTLTQKFYQHIGLTAPISGDAPKHISCEFLRSRATPHIRNLGPISIAELRKLLAKDGIDVSWRTLYTAVHNMVRTKTAVRQPDGRYVMKDAGVK